MRKYLGILLLFITLSMPALAQTFYDSVSKAKASQLPEQVQKQLLTLYDRDEDRREAALNKVLAASRQSLYEGDSFFPFKILGDYVLAIRAPQALESDEDYRDEIKDLREKALIFLIDEAKNEELTLTSREFAIYQIARIAPVENLPDFDWNEDATGALATLAEGDNLILQHAAIVGAKPITLKNGEKWESLAEIAAGILTVNLTNAKTEIQRISFLESIDILHQAKMKNDATEKIWNDVSGALGDIQSPRLQDQISELMAPLLKLKSGAMFKDEVQEAREELANMELHKKLTKEPTHELLTLLKEETDPIELEAALNRLIEESKKNRALLYVVYAEITGVTLNSEISSYKLRLLNDALIRITHGVDSTLFYYRTSLLFLGEISIHRKTPQANIPLVMLSNLLTSTDHPSLILPVLKEINLAIASDLPVWIRKRLVTLLFLQAGDSPNEKVSLEAAKYLSKIVNKSNNIAIKWEVLQRFDLLAKFAKEEETKKFAANWK